MQKSDGIGGFLIPMSFHAEIWPHSACIALTLCLKKPSERHGSLGLYTPQEAEKIYRNVIGAMTRALMQSALIRYCKMRYIRTKCPLHIQRYNYILSMSISNIRRRVHVCSKFGLLVLFLQGYEVRWGHF